MWQAVYEELKGKGLEIIAVAFDTAGKAAVEAGIRATDCKERPAILARLMGWSDELWARQAPPTYTCLIDEAHIVAELYGMTNVPQGVWIDETGHIVRPAESAGSADIVRHLNRETLEIPDDAAAEGRAVRDIYVNALRDWADKGASSRYVKLVVDWKGGRDELEAARAGAGILDKHLKRTVGQSLVDGETIEGVGDDAFFLTAGIMPWLYVRKGDTSIQIEAYGGSQEQMIAIGRKVLARLR